MSADDDIASVVKISWERSWPDPISYRFVWHYDNAPHDLHLMHFSALPLSEAAAIKMLRMHIAELNDGKEVSITIKSMDCYRPC